MKCYMFRANWIGQQDSICVIVLADSPQEALEKAIAKYPGFYTVSWQEVLEFIK